MGGRCKNIDTNPDDPSSCESDQEAMRFLNALPQRNDRRVLCRPHALADAATTSTACRRCSQSPFGREFSMLDMTIDPARHKVTKTEMEPLTMVCAQVYEHTERAIRRKRLPARRSVRACSKGRRRDRVGGTPRHAEAVSRPGRRRRRNQDIGIRTTDRFKRAYSGESALGDLLTDAMRAYMKTDIAVMNSGGIRTDLPAGALIYATCSTSRPFDNFPAIVTMTGAQSPPDAGYDVDWRRARNPASERNPLHLR